MKNLIVGAGLSGSVIANKIATELNEDVLVIDRRNHIAGNIYDYKDKETNITVHAYGPHIFHTNSEEVWPFLSKYTKWHNFFLRPNTYIDGKIVTLPFNLTALYELFTPKTAKTIENKLITQYGLGSRIPINKLKKNKDKDLKFISEYIFDNIYKNYSKKQWGTEIENIDKSVLERVPVLISYDNRYFNDKYEGIPLNGYTKMVENILRHKNIEIRLETELKDIDTSDFSRIIYTGSIDEFFDYKHGILPYRSLRFDIQTINKEYYLKSATTTFPNDYDYTRITEHKYFLDEISPKTIITVEYPEEFIISKNERFYPINNQKNLEIYEKYIKEAQKIKNLYILGRLGDYKYYNMDTVVENALKLFKEKIK